MRYWILVLCIVCVGCGADTNDALVLPTLVDFPTETATEPATDIPPSATATSTLSPTVTPSPTATMTITPQPSNTVTMTATSIPTIEPTAVSTLSFGGDRDVIANWVRDLEGVDFVEYVGIIDADNGQFFDYQIIVDNGFNNFELAQSIFDYTIDNHLADELISFSVIISDGLTATDYFYIGDDWIITNLTQVTPPTPSSMVGTCGCTRERLSCSNFNEQSSAQACFEQCLDTNGSDIFGMDRDADGLVCESLP